MRDGNIAELAAAVAQNGDFVRDDLMLRIQQRFGNAVADQVLQASASPWAAVAAAAHNVTSADFEQQAHRRPRKAGDTRAAEAERAIATLASVDGLIAEFAAARDQLAPAAARTHGEALAALFESAGATQEQLAANVPHSPNADTVTGSANPLATTLAAALERAAAEVGPHRFAGHAVGGAPPVHAAGRTEAAVMRLRAETENTIALIDIAARIRDVWIGADGAPAPEVERAIGAQLAALASRPVHFAFVRAALSSIDVWQYVATYAAPKAQRDPSTFGGLLANASAPDRTVADVDLDVARQTRQFGATVDLRGFDQATAIELLEGDTSITYLDNQQRLVSRSSKHAPQVLAMMSDLDAAARAAVLEHFRRANVLDLFCGGLPWRQVQRLDAELAAGFGDVRRELGQYYMHRDTSDHSVSHLLEQVPGVGGALEPVANFATFGFVRTHDSAYRAERQGVITDQQFAEVTVDASERAAVAIALSTTGGAIGAGAMKGAAGVVLGEAASTTVVGRVVTMMAMGAGGGAAGTAGARLSNDLLDHDLSSASEYADDATTGAKYGLALGAGAAGAGELSAAIAARLPAVAERIARLTAKFPTLAPDGPIIEALTTLGEHAGAATAHGAIRIVVAPTAAFDAIVAGALKASPAIRATIARAVARGDALAAKALKMAGIEPGNFGGPGGPSPALAAGGSTAGDMIAIDLAAGADEAAATIVKAEGVRDEAVPGTTAPAGPTVAPKDAVTGSTDGVLHDAPSPAVADDATTTSTPEPTRVRQDVYLVGPDGLDLGQLDVWEVNANGRRVFVEEKDGTGIGRLNPKTGRPFEDPVVAVTKFADTQVLSAGRRKAAALRDAVTTRGDGRSAVPDIDEVRQASAIRFEIKADTQELRAAVEERLEQLRNEFPALEFEANYGVRR